MLKATVLPWAHGVVQQQELQCHTAHAGNTSGVLAGAPRLPLGLQWGGKWGEVLLSLRGGRGKIPCPTSWSSSLCYFWCFLTCIICTIMREDYFTPFSPFITRWKCSLGVQIHPSLMPFCFEMNLLGSLEVCSGLWLGPETSFGCHFPGQHHRKPQTIREL